MSDELFGSNVSRETYDKLRMSGTGTLSILRKFTLLLLAKNHQFGRISVLVVDCLVLSSPHWHREKISKPM